MHVQLVGALIGGHQVACLHELWRLSRLASGEGAQGLSIHDANVQLEELDEVRNMASAPAMHACMACMHASSDSQSHADDMQAG